MAEERVVQDDSRERMIADHCGLVHVGGRAGVDALDKFRNPFELKSGTKSGITTARDVGLHTVQEWRTKYWIIATGRNLKEGFRPDAIYLAHPEDLEPFFSKIADRLQLDWNQASAVLKAAKKAGVNADMLTRVEEIMKRGITINNPKIPLELVRKRAMLISHDDRTRARKQIRQFVRARPLGTRRK